ncbi:hypothetical protein Nepgr_033636 [Nepenthes gracilis]|uniref:Uncharacterized protein n=1 Tax=Nepenthes gracilis TaxID=150966 RepID=A0AAD3TLT3_NEPGR|nr:hypothetical protein Nepgr_033636 [Nepenthes gracilis]
MVLLKHGQLNGIEDGFISCSLLCGIVQFASCHQIVSSADLGEPSAEAGSGCTTSELPKCCLRYTARCSCTVDPCVSAYV